MYVQDLGCQVNGQECRILGHAVKSVPNVIAWICGLDKVPLGASVIMCKMKVLVSVSRACWVFLCLSGRHFPKKRRLVCQVHRFLPRGP